MPQPDQKPAAQNASIEIVLNTGPMEAAFRKQAAGSALPLGFGEVRPIFRAFQPMVNDAAFDVSELAIVTAMQGAAHGCPVIMLPITLAARLQHKCIVYNRERGTVTTDMLEGQKVGVRAYTQTTGAWVRAILEHQYGVDSTKVTWLTQEPPHVNAATEPDNVHRDPNGRPLTDMLRDGTIVAAIFGNDLPDADWLAPVIPEPDAAAKKAFERDGIVPINHILSVSKNFVRENPQAVREIYSMFRSAREELEGVNTALYPAGFEEMRHSVELLLEMSWHQKLLPRQISFDEFFAGAAELIG